MTGWLPWFMPLDTALDRYSSRAQMLMAAMAASPQPPATVFSTTLASMLQQWRNSEGAPVVNSSRYCSHRRASVRTSS